MKTSFTNCLIIGSGPAGYTAAIYAARADMKPMLYEGMQPGGQLTITTEIENFPGFPNGISGAELMEQMRRQALNFDVDMRRGTITKADFSSRPFKVWVDDDDYEEHVIEAKTVIIATGATARWLGLESESEFRGGGVSACATCDGFFYRGMDVAVVGGGDTACEEATYLAKICKKVYLIHRRDQLRASKAMQCRVMETENIIPVWNSRIVEFFGEVDKFDKVLRGIKVENIPAGEITEIAVDGVFIAIGHHPNSDVFKDQIHVDQEGYIITQGHSTQTNIPGVFAAGDIQDTQFRQAITAAASGCMAAIEAERFLLDAKD
ncbi:MAG: thioredoxin-disulfide reductase [Bacteroidales bacterium]|jgi:thioredoxin reductase (NADPH)|nr:thioredoxin-disulfide reductase [Bacteroidales bacterium]